MHKTRFLTFVGIRDLPNPASYQENVEKMNFFSSQNYTMDQWTVFFGIVLKSCRFIRQPRV